LDLTGTAAGTMDGYNKGTRFNDHERGTITLVVGEQHGRIFAGNLTVAGNNTPIFSSEVAGATGHDGKSIKIVRESGYCIGKIPDTGSLECTYVNDTPPFSIPVDEFRRVARPNSPPGERMQE
jgi:hypothetical protein